MALVNPIEEAASDNKHEILIEGGTLEHLLKNNDNLIPKSLYQLTQLNFMKLSNSSLTCLSADIAFLSNMTNLVLQNNKLVCLPDEIGSLSKLKLLDVSSNKLTEIPETLGNLANLSTFNLRNNNLTKLITFDNCTALAHLDFQYNQIEKFDEICHDKLVMLSDLEAGSNNIEEIPSEISVFTNLKSFSISNNSIKEITSEILQCSKLKDLNLKGNPLTDRRLRKLVESERGYTKTILEYIKTHSKQGKGSSSKDKKKKNKKENGEEEIDNLCERLSVLTASKESTLTVKVSTEVRDIRGHIICCVFKNIDLTGTKLKKFLSIQTKLHETICDKRVSATIATHDLSKVNGPLELCAKVPSTIMILPLNRKKMLSAKSLFATLKDEAENVRKQMKRNTYSGIHKFLYLVEGWEKWPCLVDSKGVVISFPPITNADNTKIEETSTDIFVEVTSSVSLNKAKEVMEALIFATMDGDLTKDVTENNKKHLQVCQVRILNEDENLKMVYPSRTDLVVDNSRKVTIVRA